MRPVDLDLPIGIKEEVLAQPTRARIYRYLLNHRVAASTEEIAQSLELHPNGVRRHLDRLAESGLIERRLQRGQRGRPGDRWAIAADANLGGMQPSAYAALARWLARAIKAEAEGTADIEATGHQIGRELAPSESGDTAEVFGDLLSAMGFQPVFQTSPNGDFVCTMMNCPYRESVRGNADVICKLHRGITRGLLSKVDPAAELVDFRPKDPVEAGCVVCVSSDGGA